MTGGGLWTVPVDATVIQVLGRRDNVMQKRTVMGMVVAGTLGFGVGAAWAGEHGQDQPADKAAYGDEAQKNGDYGAGMDQGNGDQPGRKSSISQTETAMVTVDMVDKDKRRLTLKDEQVKGFDRVKKGDRINLTYHKSIAMAVLPPGSEPMPMEERSTTAADRGAGKGATGRQISASAEVVKVDTESHELTVEAADGSMHQVTVNDPQLQRTLKTIEAGDVVQLTYTEAVAASIEHAGKTKPAESGNGSGSEY
jgi:ribosomal 50S subunit-recycling heat shock protein